MHFVSDQAGKKEASTIKAYLGHVVSMHTDLGLKCPQARSAILQRVICGIKRVHGKKGRAPKAMLEQLDCLKPGDLVLHGACTMAFAGFLQCGKLTVKSADKFNVSVDLSINSIKFVPDLNNTTHDILWIPRSKTDTFRTGMDVYLAKAPDAITCPVAALCTLISFYRQEGSGLDHEPHTPLFVIKGKAMTRSWFINSIRNLLLRAGHDPSPYSGHSFRRGAASSTAAASYSNYKIQLLGRWRSDCHKLYIELPVHHILSLSTAMHWVQPQDTSFDPLALRGVQVIS
jgi:hypothetical protein